MEQYLVTENLMKDFANSAALKEALVKLDELFVDVLNVCSEFSEGLTEELYSMKKNKLELEERCRD